MAGGVSMNKPAVVVTGVSTGIGNGTLHELIKAGYHVFGSVRKREDAERLSKELGDSYTPLVFDVTDASAVARGADAVRQALGTDKLSGLVNSAGEQGPAGPLIDIPVDAFRKHIEVGLVSLLTVTQAFFPLLRKKSDGNGRPARIVNIASVAGLMAMPFGGPYVAAKHGVEGFSDSLRQECMLYGVDVVVIEPATIATSMWDKMEKKDLSIYANSPYKSAMEKMRNTMVASGRRGSPPEHVGRLVVKVLGARRPRVRYMTGKGSVNFWMMMHFPARQVDRMIARSIGLLGRQ